MTAEHAQIRIFDEHRRLLLCTQDQVKISGAEADLRRRRRSGSDPAAASFQELGYRVIVPRLLPMVPKGEGSVWLLYAGRRSRTSTTRSRACGCS